MGGGHATASGVWRAGMLLTSSTAQDSPPAEPYLPPHVGGAE